MCVVFFIVSCMFKFSLDVCKDYWEYDFEFNVLELVCWVVGI